MKYWKVLNGTIQSEYGDIAVHSRITYGLNKPTEFDAIGSPVDLGDLAVEISKEEYENYIFTNWNHGIDISFITTTFIDNIRSYATYELLSDPQNTNVEIIKHLQTIQNALAANDLEDEAQDTIWTTVPSQTKNNVLQLIRRYATDADVTWDKDFQFWHKIYTFIKLSTNQGNKDILNQLELANGLLAHN